MFIQFDTQEKILKKFADKTCTCSKCHKRTVEFTIWRKYFQLYWIPFIPLGKIEISAWCNSCRQNLPENTRLKYHLSNAKTPLYLYSGLIILSLFMITVVSGIVNERINAESNTKLYLDAPEIGDVYLMNDCENQDTFYYYLRLADINPTKDSLSFYFNQKNYSQKPSKLASDDYFLAEEVTFTSIYIKNQFLMNKIISIDRNHGMPESYKKIKPSKKTDPNYVDNQDSTSIKTWQTLLSLKFDIYFDEEVDDVVFKPIFNESIKKLDGTIITVKAFTYSENISNGTILLSVYPFCQSKYLCTGTCHMPSIENFIEIPKTPEITSMSCKSCIIRGELNVNVNTDDLLQVPYSLKNIDFIYCEDLIF